MFGFPTRRLIYSFNVSASLLAKQLHAWRVVLRSAKIVQMEPETLARHQTYYVKSGGLLNAIEDFYSVKPTNVRYFEGSNEVCIIVKKTN